MLTPLVLNESVLLSSVEFSSLFFFFASSSFSCIFFSFFSNFARFFASFSSFFFSSFGFFTGLKKSYSDLLAVRKIGEERRSPYSIELDPFRSHLHIEGRWGVVCRHREEFSHTAMVVDVVDEIHFDGSYFNDLQLVGSLLFLLFVFSFPLHFVFSGDFHILLLLLILLFRDCEHSNNQVFFLRLPLLCRHVLF